MTFDARRNWYYWNWRKKDDRTCPLCLKALHLEEKGGSHRYTCTHCRFESKWEH